MRAAPVGPALTELNLKLNKCEQAKYVDFCSLVVTYWVTGSRADANLGNWKICNILDFLVLEPT